MTTVATCVKQISFHIKHLFNNVRSSETRSGKTMEPSLLRSFPDERLHQEKHTLHLPVDENCFKIAIQHNGNRLLKLYAERIFPIFLRLHGKSEYPGAEPAW